MQDIPIKENNSLDDAKRYLNADEFNDVVNELESLITDTDGGNVALNGASNTQIKDSILVMITRAFTNFKGEFGVGATTSIPNFGADINVYKPSGIYYIESTASNIPTADNYAVLNLRYSTLAQIQVLYNATDNNTTQGHLYIRVVSGGTGVTDSTPSNIESFRRVSTSEDLLELQTSSPISAEKKRTQVIRMLVHEETPINNGSSSFALPQGAYEVDLSQTNALGRLDTGTYTAGVDYYVYVAKQQGGSNYGFFVSATAGSTTKTLAGTNYDCLQLVQFNHTAISEKGVGAIPNNDWQFRKPQPKISRGSATPTVNDDVSGTADRSGTTTTITVVGHGHNVGHYIYCDFATGIPDGIYNIETVINDDTFTITTASGADTGIVVTLRRLALLANPFNVSSVSDLANGQGWTCFAENYPDDSYSAFAYQDGLFTGFGNPSNTGGEYKNASGFRFYTSQGAGSTDSTILELIAIGEAN